jgi:tRNA(Arg) A34 adenosine deaminase TadA
VKLQQRFEIVLPVWTATFVASWLSEHPDGLSLPDGRMQLAVALARENVRRETGGPFGAIAVEESSGRLLGMGVNLVDGSRLSVAHAEIVALSLAQKAAGCWNLGGAGGVQLVTSCEPCAMCLGAVHWSGVSSLACGARREDAQAVGFDEGDRPADWVGSLQRRGIGVTLDVLRDKARQVLKEYAAAGGVIYQP